MPFTVLVRGRRPALARHARAVLACGFAVLASIAAGAAADDPQLAAYSATIRPLLAARCHACHGGLEQEAGLRLDTVALAVAGGESGAAIVKGDPAGSLLVKRISAEDPALRMPPEGEGEPFSADEIELVRSWIAAGSPAPSDERPQSDPRSHWAFQPRVRPAVPPSAAAIGAGHPIDAFLAGPRERAGVTAQPEAPRHVLIRRLFIDLVGLPPEPLELAAIEADASPDWYEKLVDRLLADPRHGERWARHWMDVWRYADWWGLGDQHRNSQKHMWHFRDWIVESLNDDLGYDEMLRLMLAADELHPDDPARLRATGFLARNWFLFNRTPWLDDTVEHVGKGLLGLTLNCSKCHAHKYDPIQQEDYYRFRAFFEPIEARLDVVPGEADLEKDGIPRVFDGHLDRPTYRFVRGEDTRPDTSRAIAPGVPQMLAFESVTIEPVALPKTASEPHRRAWVPDAYLATAARAVARAEEAVSQATDKKAAADRAAADTAATTPQSPPPADRAAAKDAVEAATRQLALAESTLAVERAAAAAVERRVEATRAGWTAETTPTPEATGLARDAARAAVRAEREAAVAVARRKVVELEGRLAAASADKQAGLQKELESAGVAMEKAVAAVAEPGEAFTPFVGARWTPTRFKGSGGDDPAVAFPATSTGRRSALARWITDPRHPLTARVAVNHIWMRHLGRPLVATVFDFGTKGQPPTHPDLLDWLASELVDGPAGGPGFRMKHLHRLICTSAAYRMASSPRGAGAAAEIDPDNRLLWRREPIRLEAQVVRDAVLSLAGTLDTTTGGPPVPVAAQAASRRRSLYFWHSEISRNPFLATFDDAAPRECYRREQSIVPQQALALANSALVQDAATRIVERVQAAADGPLDDAAFLGRAFTMVLLRGPTPEERAACEASLAKWRAVSPPPAAGLDPARAHLVWALLNHNDFVTLR